IGQRRKRVCKPDRSRTVFARIFRQTTTRAVRLVECCALVFGRNPSEAPAMTNLATTFWRRLTRGGQRVWKRPDWDAFAGADWTERIMNVVVTDRFHAKQGRSTGRWILESEGRR